MRMRWKLFMSCGTECCDCYVLTLLTCPTILIIADIYAYTQSQGDKALYTLRLEIIFCDICSLASDKQTLGTVYQCVIFCQMHYY